MKPLRHPVVERYLAQLEAAIAGLEPADRSEVLQEIRNHIAEATAVGTPLDAVLDALGPPDALGRAYAIELLLQPQKDRRRHPAQRWVNVVVLIALFSIPTLVAVSTLASVGISFVASGVFVFVVGILEGLGVFPWPGVSNVPPLVAIGLGPGMVILGSLALTALRFYIRFVVRTVRAAVPAASRVVRSPRSPSTGPVMLATLLLWTLSTTAAVGQPSGTAGPLALVGGTIYVSPTEKPIPNGVILIEDGKITSVGSRSSVRVPAKVEVLDCTGLTITAGFWNSHVHFLQRKWSDAATLPAVELERQLQTMLTQYGFTSVFDTWSMWENTRRLRDRIDAGELAGPRIRSTGEATFPMAMANAPAPAQASWGALGFMPLDKFQSASGMNEAEALASAKTLLDANTDGLKLYAVTVGRNGIALPESTIQALVKEAHGRGKPVFAHPTTEAGVMTAVRSGVDVLAHATPQSGPWSDGTVAAMKQAGIALVPTLTLWRYELRHERISMGDRFEETAVGQLRAWVRAGGVVLFGTDVGYMTDYDPTREYVLMARAGMTFPQILASLTTAPAQRFGAAAQLGRIAPGLSADLTILRGDPSKNIEALAAVQYTIRDGRLIYRVRHEG